MQKDGQIDPNELDFDNYSRSDDFSSLNFKQEDDSDPLEIDKFIHENPIKYIKFHISTIYSVKYKGRLVAYFTLSMMGIKTDELLQEDIREGIEFSYYPALLLGRMGVERNYQSKGIGTSILNHCLGLAQNINEDIACNALVLHTTREIGEYYRKKGFKNIEPKSSKRLITMYRLT